MSDSEDESGGALGLDAILWGNIGEDDEVEADYLDKVKVSQQPLRILKAHGNLVALAA